MQEFEPDSTTSPSVLATDLDGTLIPLGDDEENKDALLKIAEWRQRFGFKLVFATGRHYDSVLQAIKEYGLPGPEWIVCDVGTSIYNKDGHAYAEYEPYSTCLSELVRPSSREDVEACLNGLEGLVMQKPENQKPYKISYFCEQDLLDSLLDKINQSLCMKSLPFECMGSIDPFKQCGMLDVLPREVSKASALLWLSTHADFTPDSVIYAGDSGNDEAALASGFRAIVVANASDGLAETVRNRLAARGLVDRLFLAKYRATSGVLQGCRHFGLMGKNPA